MKQSTIVFIAILVAFVIYITVRDQLPQYFQLFTKKDSGTTVATPSPAPTDVIPPKKEGVVTEDEPYGPDNPEKPRDIITDDDPKSLINGMMTPEYAALMNMLLFDRGGI